MPGDGMTDDEITRLVDQRMAEQLRRFADELGSGVRKTQPPPVVEPEPETRDERRARFRNNLIAQLRRK